MQTLFNRILINQVRLDSGSLTMLGTVIHNFSEPGEYLGTLLRGAETAGRFRLAVDEHASAMQVNIDLRQLDLPVAKHFESEQKNRFVLNPRGYVMFHVASGAGGYAVVIRKFDGKRDAVVFDSRELKNGDLFAVTLIRPGTYAVTNINTKAKGEIVVAYPKVEKIAFHPPDPVSIECTEKAFEPNLIKIKTGQGQVFRVKAPSRITIELVKPEDKPGKKPEREERE